MHQCISQPRNRVLPNELLEFYEIANGGMLSYNVEILEIQWIEEVNQEFREEVKTATILQNEYQQIEKLSKSGWIFAKSFYEDGKFFYLDGKVLYLSGRIGYSVAGEWDSIYEFLWDLLW